MNIAFFLTPKEEIAYVYDDFTLRQVLEKMERYRFAAVPVIRRDGQYVGTLTEGDILWEIKRRSSFSFRDSEVIPIMAVPRRLDNIPVNISTDVREVVEKSLNQNFVPVVDDRGVFIGIITRKNIIGYFRQNVDNML